MNTAELLKRVEDKACRRASDHGRDYCVAHPDPTGAWAQCQDGSFMLWVAEYAGVDRRRLAIPAAEIAQLALDRHWRINDRRPYEALAVLRRWVAGAATDDELIAATAAAAATGAWALAAARAATAVLAAGALAAGARAATAAAAATAVLAAGARAAAAATAETAVADAEEARISSLVESAEIVRRHISIAEVIAALGVTEE